MYKKQVIVWSILVFIFLITITFVNAVGIVIAPDGDSNIVKIEGLEVLYNLQDSDAYVSTEVYFSINDTYPERRVLKIYYRPDPHKNWNSISYDKKSIFLCADIKCNQKYAITPNITADRDELIITTSMLPKGEYYFKVNYTIKNFVFQDGFHTYVVWLNYNDPFEEMYSMTNVKIEVQLENTNMIIKEVLSDNYYLDRYENGWRIRFEEIGTNVIWYENSTWTSPWLWAFIGAILPFIITKVYYLLKKYITLNFLKNTKLLRKIRRI